MESNVLTSIPGIEYYPIISLLLFFLVFALLILWFFRVDRKRLDSLAQEVLEEDNQSFATHGIDSDPFPTNHQTFA